MAASIELKVGSSASASGPRKNKGGKGDSSSSSSTTSMVRKPSFPSVEEIGLFSLDLDDGSTWSPNSVVDSRKTVDLFQLESDILTLGTICSASTVKEDVTLRRVGRSLKSNGAACSTAKKAFCHLKSQGFSVALAYSRHRKGANRDGGDIFTPRHEFLKVEVEGSTIVVDTDFRSSFAIARPSYYYSKVFEEVPSTYVGSEERLRLLVAFMSEQLRRNFSHTEMPCPPWRQNKALLNTWAL